MYTYSYLAIEHYKKIEAMEYRIATDWEIFEVQNFQGLVISKFFANKFSRTAI